MIKVMWFLKRADHLTLEEFRKWWIEDHAPDIVEHQAPHLNKYVVDVRVENDTLPGKPAEGVVEWDGIAEQWFETEADFAAVYGKPKSPTRGDTLAHVSRFQRMVVREYPIRVKGQV